MKCLVPYFQLHDIEVVVWVLGRYFTYFGGGGTYLKGQEESEQPLCCLPADDGFYSSCLVQSAHAVFLYVCMGECAVSSLPCTIKSSVPYVSLASLSPAPH